MRKTLNYFVCFCVITFCIGASAQTEVEAGYARVKEAAIFAVGPVGFAGVRSQTDRDLRMLMQDPASLQWLEKLYAEGTPAAKAYALFGFYKLQPGRFHLLRAQTPSQMPLKRMTGCLIFESTLGSVIDEIAAGKFR